MRLISIGCHQNSHEANYESWEDLSCSMYTLPPQHAESVTGLESIITRSEEIGTKGQYFDLYGAVTELA